ncbi:MAG: right-handed parallel beta-helix repeat-containing protein [Desulfococcaceae bacterium]|nr:right-handed parallel beta-helix repeat-containing protein [Desulfococcaceae bacterium]
MENFDPVFSNDYKLSGASPCIAKGQSNANPTPYDLAGNVRSHGRIDMGAYEYGAPVYEEEAEEPENDPDPNAVYYVRPGASGDGSSWTDATDLQTALEKAQSGDAVWVAKGVYTPVHRTNPNDARSVTFTLVEGVIIYGGFNGDEAALNERDWKNNLSVLSGDIDNNDGLNFQGISTTINGANAYHVVMGGTNNTASAVIDGFTITGGQADGNGDSGENQGGGMLNWLSKPTIRNCNFVKNTGVSGGAMMNAKSSPIIKNCVFKQNTTANASGYCGGIYNYEASPEISDCIFEQNFSHNQGGGMLIIAGSSPKITDCKFINNSAQTQGGAILHSSGSSAIISDCTFDGNSGQGGGGILIDGSSPSLTDCIFFNNSAINSGNGGALSNDNGSDSSITNCRFISNSSEGQGGAMIIGASSPNITGCTFSENSANNGAAIFNHNTSAPVIRNSVFTNNSAETQAGGIANFSGSSPEISNCTFEDNTSFNGGGIFNDSSNAVITDCSFKRNSSVSWAGAIYTASSHIEIHRCIFTSNRSLTGGGITNSNSTFTMTDSVLEKNSSSGDGGGMFNSETGLSKVINCRFLGNKSVGSGGGMLNEGGSLDIINTVFSGNHADNTGGAIYNRNEGNDVRVLNCTFSENSASHGDGLHNNNMAETTVINSVFWNNGQEEIINDGGTVTVSYSIIKDGWSGAGMNNDIQNPLFIRSPNISASPCDYGNLRLTPCSPGVNSGDNTAAAGIPADPDGNERVINEIVDKGAYELTGGQCTFHPSQNPQMLVIKTLYDDFSATALDEQKWAPGIIGSDITETYEIVNQTALLTTEGDGKRVIRFTALHDTDSPYMEATVTVKSGSYITGNKSRARLSGIFYNDTFEESDPGNGYEGDVYAMISICHYETEGLVVRYLIGRFPTASVDTEDVWAIDFLSMPIEFETPYTLSIQLVKDAFVLTCINTTASVQEQKTVPISTPIYPSKNHAEQRKIMARIDSGSSGKLMAEFDNIYVGKYQYADVNNDTCFDLRDVISVLRIIAGHDSTNINLSADVNRDGFIGLEEAFFFLKFISEN